MALRPAAIPLLVRVLLAPAIVVPASGTLAQDRALDSRTVMMAKDHYEKGRKLAAGQRFAEAEKEFLEAARIFPEFADAYVELGHLAMGRKDYSGGLARYQRAEEALASLQGIKRLQAVERLRRIQESIDLLREQIADLSRSQRAADAGKIQQAEVRLERLQHELTTAQPPEEIPRPPELPFFIGTALMNLERFDEAVASFRRAIAQRPAYGEAHNNLAVIHYYRKEYPDAWREVHAAERAGIVVNSQFREELKVMAAEPPETGDR